MGTEVLNKKRWAFASPVNGGSGMGDAMMCAIITERYKPAVTGPWNLWVTSVEVPR